MRPRAEEIIIFALLFVTFAYFDSGEGWNANSRLDLTYAIVEQGTVRIDDYWLQPHMETRDVAVFENHAYSDKIFGTSVLGIPAFAAIKTIELVRGERLHPRTRRYVVTLLSVGLLGATAGVLLFRLLLLLSTNPLATHNRIGAAALAVSSILGTQLVLYGTIFMAYMPVVFFELALLLLIQRRKPDPPAVWCGVLGGAALLCEYTAVFAVAAIYLIQFVTMRRRVDIWKTCAATFAMLLPFFIYVYAVFGKFAIPYQYEFHPMFRWFMEQGIMGATVPKPLVLFLITLHPYRGIFFHSPLLLMSILGVVLMFRSREKRWLGAAITLATVAYLLFNSAYYMWWGGWSFGARILIPAIPLLAIALQPAWESGKAARILASVLACISIGIHLVVLSVAPQPQDLNELTTIEMLLYPEWQHRYVPLFTETLLPAFVRGELQHNAGRAVGIPGAWSLLPLLFIWMATFVALVLTIRRPAASATCA